MSASLEAQTDDIVAPLRLKLAEISGRPMASLSLHEPFVATGLIDSLAIVDLIAYVEEQFDFVVDPMDLSTDNFGSLAGIEAYVRRQRGLAR